MLDFFVPNLELQMTVVHFFVQNSQSHINNFYKTFQSNMKSKSLVLMSAFLLKNVVGILSYARWEMANVIKLAFATRVWK